MKTTEIIQDLESLASCGLRTSENVQGRGPVLWAMMMAASAFRRLVLNAISVLRLTPGSRFCQPIGDLQFWDLPSVASLSRNAVEAYFVLRYMAEKLPDEESQLRELVWRFHEMSERHKILQDALPQSPGISVLAQQVATLRKSVKAHPAFQKLAKQRQKRIVQGEAAKLRSNEELCYAAGVDRGYYSSMFKYGSNHTHSSPFCFAQMDSFTAEEEARREEDILWAALQTSAGFLALAIQDFIKLWPDQNTGISQEERFRLLFWEQVLRQGPASLASKACK